MPSEMEPVIDSTAALLICDGSSSEAIGSGSETTKGADHQSRLCMHLCRATLGHHREPPSPMRIAPSAGLGSPLFFAGLTCFLGGAVPIRLWKSPESC
jgi:hypothetical protein